MSDRSSIEWTEATWNPTTGCDRVSPGCRECYAALLAARLKAMGSAKYQNDGDPVTSGPGFALTVHEDSLGIPLGWKSPRRVFVNSMSDLFHEDVPAEFVHSVFEVMADCPQHEFQVLTKRAQRLKKLGAHIDWPSNVWMGVSVETNRYLFRVKHLLATEAKVKFLSIEPMLGPLPDLDLTGIDWVIVGGESGPRSRPMEADWVRDVRDRCVEAGVPFFFKQWGGRTPKAGGRTLDGTTWDEFPMTPASSAA